MSEKKIEELENRINMLENRIKMLENAVAVAFISGGLYLLEKLKEKTEKENA
jgi:archaellum component FlaC